MKVTEQVAKHLTDVFFGGNWTAVNLKDQLADVTWEQATMQAGDFHTIAELVYHMNYFVAVTLKVLKGGPLDAPEKLSFDHPPIESQQDWDRLMEQTWSEAENLALAIEQMPEDQLWEPFVKPEYGNHFRCLIGPIEHCHYHLGQIAMLKTLLATDNLDSDEETGNDS